MGWFRHKQDELDSIVRKLKEKDYDEWSFEEEWVHHLMQCGVYADRCKTYLTNIGSFQIRLRCSLGDTGGSQPEAKAEFVLSVMDSEDEDEAIVVAAYVNERKVKKLYQHVMRLHSESSKRADEAKAEEKAKKEAIQHKQRQKSMEHFKKLLD